MKLILTGHYPLSKWSCHRILQSIYYY